MTGRQPSLWRRAALAQVCARRSLLAGGGAAVACEGRGAERRGPGQPRRQSVEWRVGRSDVCLRRTRSPAGSCRSSRRPAAAEEEAVVGGRPLRFSPGAAGFVGGVDGSVRGLLQAPCLLFATQFGSLFTAWLGGVSSWGSSKARRDCEITDQSRGRRGLRDHISQWFANAITPHRTKGPSKITHTHSSCYCCLTRRAFLYISGLRCALQLARRFNSPAPC